MSIFNKKLNILVLGKNSMLGHDVYKLMNDKSKLRHSIINRVDVLSSGECDFGTYHTIENILTRNVHYDYVINCIAYTDTKKAEHEDIDKSFILNSLVCKRLAELCLKYKMKLIHISTDYVFSEMNMGCLLEDGSISERAKYNNKFHNPEDQPFPVNVYGTHKLIGEMYIQNILPKKQYMILRTSWLYGNHNHKSFVHRFLKNVYTQMMTDKTKPITLPDDEYSIPTSTLSLTYMIYTLIQHNEYGIIHCTNTCGFDLISRLEFGRAILNILSYVDPDVWSKDNRPSLISANGSNQTQIRYPKFSPMNYNSFYDKYLSIFDDWYFALKHFLSTNYDDIMNWLTSSAKNDIIDSVNKDS